MAEVSFTTTKNEAELLHRIAQRAVETYEIDLLGITMDITAVHANGCPLDLERLLAAGDFDFSHDIAGIVNHIDRDTGQLRGFFIPRFAARGEEREG